MTDKLVKEPTRSVLNTNKNSVMANFFALNKQINEIYENAILLYQVGSFYEYYALKPKKDEDKKLLDRLLGIEDKKKQFYGNPYFEQYIKITGFSKEGKKGDSLNIYITEDDEIFYATYPVVDAEIRSEDWLTKKFLDFEKGHMDSDDEEVMPFIKYTENPEVRKMNEKHLKRKNNIKHVIPCITYMAGGGVGMFKKYIDRLIDNGFSVAIMNQDKNNVSKSKTREAVKRYLELVITPSTFIKDDEDYEEYHSNSGNYIACVRFNIHPKDFMSDLKRRKKRKTKMSTKAVEMVFGVGMSVIDIISGEVIYHEYSKEFMKHNDNFSSEIGMLDELEYFLSTYTPNEILVIYETDDDDNDDKLSIGADTQKNISRRTFKQEDIKLFMEYVKYGSSNVKYIGYSSEKMDTMKSAKTLKDNLALSAYNSEKGKFQEVLIEHVYLNNKVTLDSNKHQQHKLCETFDIFMSQYDFKEQALAFHSLCFLLDFIQKRQMTLLSNIHLPMRYLYNENMVIGNHSLRQLNYIGNNKDTRTGIAYDRSNMEITTVEALLNRCKTVMGKKTMKQILMKPTTNIEWLNNEYNKMEYVIENWKEFFSQQHQKMNDIYNIELVMKSLSTSNMKMNSLKHLLISLNVVESIKEETLEYLDSTSTSTSTLTSTPESAQELLKQLFDFPISDLLREINSSIYILSDLNDEMTDKMIRYISDNNQIYKLVKEVRNYNIFKPSINEIIDTEYANFLYNLENIMEIQKAINQFIFEYEVSVATEKNKSKTGKSKVRVKTTPDEYCKMEIKTEDNGVRVSLFLTKSKWGLLKSAIETDTKLEIKYKPTLFDSDEEDDIDEEGYISYKLDMKTFKTIEQKKGTMTLCFNELDEYSNEIYNSIDEYKNTIKEEYDEFQTKLYKHFALFDVIIYFIKDFDILCTKSHLAYKNGYCKPKIKGITVPIVNYGRGNLDDMDNFVTMRNDWSKSLYDKSPSNLDEMVDRDNDGIGAGDGSGSDEFIDETTSHINAKAMRHILIEQMDNSQECYVPNDVVLNSTNNMLLFGTNAVGKSSLIKSIGICVVLAQCGFYVPCSEFTYYPYRSLYTRILNNDDIHKGLSTFAVEAVELKTILRNANKNTLVLGDELCSGTEIKSATKIFTTGLMALSKLYSSFIFATHFHNVLREPVLRDFIYDCDDGIYPNPAPIHIKHLSVSVNEKRELVMKRKLQAGSGTQNYGLKVAKAYGIPDWFLNTCSIVNGVGIGDDEAVMSEDGKISASICDKGTSVYNRNKVKFKCQICGRNRVDDIHHDMPQEKADKRGLIEGRFHKNQKANLLSLCKECHNDIHNSSPTPT